MTASIDPLTDDVAKLIDGFIWKTGINAPTIAAMAVLGHPQIAAGLAALPVLAKLRQQHQPRRWSPDSDAATCSCGNGRCQVGEVLAAC